MSQISVQNLSKSFVVPHQRRTTLKESLTEFWRKPLNEKFYALTDISFQIKPGQFIGLIGPNGSGKSTLLKLLAGIYKPDSGQINVRGTIAPLLELGIGFQQDLSARDNIFINAALLGLPASKIRQILPDIVQFAEIGHFLDLKIKNYSSGMRQRLAFAIAAHIDADIYLCDEVFAVGDENFQKKSLAVFQRWREQGKTIILVSHNTTQIAELCDHAILLQNGRIQAEGPASTVVQAYQQINAAPPDQSTLAASQSPASVTSAPNDFSQSPLRLTGLQILASNETEISQLRTGGPLHLRIHFQADQPIENPVFGLAIHREDGTHITGPNTKTSGFRIPIIRPGQGFIDCTFPSLPLLAGRYHITISAFDYACLHAFDYLDKRFSFVVEPNRDNQYGLMDLSASWYIEGLPYD